MEIRVSFVPAGFQSDHGLTAIQPADPKGGWLQQINHAAAQQIQKSGNITFLSMN
jgi:hypothetical protein